MANDSAEDRYVRSMLDLYGARFDDTIRAMTSDADRLRDSWAQSYADQREASAARVAAIKEDTRSWIRDRYAADGEAGQNVRQAPRGAQSLGASVLSPGAGPAGPIQDPRQAELERAQEIAAMDFSEYAQRRDELGVRSASSRGMWG